MAGSLGGKLDVRSLRVIFDEGSIAVRSDADLIRLFLTAQRETAEAAFETLIARHGPMVLGVCRRILRDEHMAEDAFQAVFLILARKARSVRVDDTLGRWLHGVSRRVAVRAKDLATREIPALSASQRHAEDPGVEAVRDEIRHLIGLEVARLPRKYREAVALYHLDGLSHDQAADALALPVGTVRSRLSRARDLLRTRLVRRGLAPAAFAAWLGSRPAVACVPSFLMQTTLKNSGGVGAVAISPAVLVLVHHTMRSLLMMKAIGAGVVAATLGCLTIGAVVLARGNDEPKSEQPPAALPKAGPNRDPAVPSLAARFEKIKAEYESANRALWDAVGKVNTKHEQNVIYGRMAPDLVAYTRRMIDLAAIDPKDPAVRDALLWVVTQPGKSSDSGPYGDEFARAAALLVRHHGDDPAAIAGGLGLSNVLSFQRDTLLLGFYATAKAHEAKGVARLALAQYIERKAAVARDSRIREGRQSIRLGGFVDDDGKVIEKEIAQSDEEYAYLLHLKQCDPVYLRELAERLYQEVIDEYADVAHITLKTRELEAVLSRPSPKWNGEPLTQDKRKGLERGIARARTTLGEIAQARLDDMNNLSVGKPAPEIEGVSTKGEPLKLSDYRGKVVVMAFWGSWCGPCMRQIPHERELAERHKDRPFAMLGVNTDKDVEVARKVIEAEGMTWPNWYDGSPHEGPITQRYHIAGYPTVFVIDAEGKIRSKNAFGQALNKLVDELLAEVKQKATGQAIPTPSRGR